MIPQHNNTICYQAIRIWGICVLAFLFICMAARGGAAQQTSSPANSDNTGTRKPAFTNTTRVEETILSTQHTQVLILPSQPLEAGEARPQISSGVIGKVPAEPQRLPEGSFLSAHKARIDRENDWLVIHPAKTKILQEPPLLRLLPNRMLETLEANLALKKKSMDYVFTGRVTEFEGTNYLLIENLMEVRSQPPAVKVEKSKQTDKTKKPANQSAATKPATGREPTADDISDQLMKYKPLRPVDMPNTQPLPISMPANAIEPVPSGKSARWQEDSMLIDRIGRVVREGKWWMLAFENQGIFPQDKPIRILPNRLLENVLIASEGGSMGVVFTISGKITVYRGANYLFLHKALPRRGMGNLQ